MQHRILLIEDNTEIRENIAEILELSNYIIDTAENGIRSKITQGRYKKYQLKSLEESDNTDYDRTDTPLFRCR